MAFTHKLSNLIDRHAKTGRVDFRRGSKSADKHGNVVCFAESTDDIRKKKSPSFILAQAALKLPAHKRMKFRILVDGTIDPVSSPRSVKRAMCSCKSAGAFCVVTGFIADLRYRGRVITRSNTHSCEQASRGRLHDINRVGKHGNTKSAPLRWPPGRRCVTEYNMSRLNPFAFVIGLLVIAAQWPSFADESYPSRPIRSLSALPQDQAATLSPVSSATKLGDLLGQTVVVEDRPGASSMVATDYVARAIRTATRFYWRR